MPYGYATSPPPQQIPQAPPAEDAEDRPRDPLPQAPPEAATPRDRVPEDAPVPEREIPQQDRIEQPTHPPEGLKRPPQPGTEGIDLEKLSNVELTPPLQSEESEDMPENLDSANAPGSAAGPQVGAGRLPMDEDGNFTENAIEEYFRDFVDIRVAAEIAELKDILRTGIEEFDVLGDDFFDSGGDGHFQSPQNGRGPGGGGGSPPPSGIPTGGFAATGGTGGPTANQLGLLNPGGRTWERTAPNGGTIYYFGGTTGDGDRTTARTTEDSRLNSRETYQVTESSDGSRTTHYTNHVSGETSRSTTYSDGSSVAHYHTPGQNHDVTVAKEPDGTVTKIVAYDTPDGRVVRSSTDVAGNPGDQPTQAEMEMARWLWRQHNLGNSPADTVDTGTRVNPEDPDGSGAEAPAGPRVSAPGITVNPPPDEASSGARAVSEETAGHLRRQLEDAAAGPGAPPEPEPGSGGGM